MPTLKPNGRRLNGKGSKWITPKRRREIYQRDGWRCVYCLKSLRVLKHLRTIDHVIPKKLGGSHRSENLVTACKGCNDRKQDKDVQSLLKKIQRTLDLPPYRLTDEDREQLIETLRETGAEQ